MRRRRRTLAVTALAALTLAACGSEQPDSPGAPARSVDAVPAGKGAAFTAMLDEVARECPPPGTKRKAPATPKGEAPTAPVEPPPGATVAPPPGGAVEPVAPTAGPEAELDARDWCAGVHHEQRVAEALLRLGQPDPAQVRKVLNGLGYIDERIHGLKRSGAVTTFAVDLRDKGGRLCVEGTANGELTEVEMCVAPAEGAFDIANPHPRP
jgi:membrane-bound lytic murein transglycosylase B